MVLLTSPSSEGTASQGGPLSFTECLLRVMSYGPADGSKRQHHGFHHRVEKMEAGEAWGDHLAVKCSWAQLQKSVISAAGRLSEKEFEASLYNALRPVSKQVTQAQTRKQLVAKVRRTYSPGYLYGSAPGGRWGIACAVFFVSRKMKCCLV